MLQLGEPNAMRTTTAVGRYGIAVKGFSHPPSPNQCLWSLLWQHKLNIYINCSSRSSSNWIHSMERRKSKMEAEKELYINTHWADISSRSKHHIGYLSGLLLHGCVLRVNVYRGPTLSTKALLLKPGIVTLIYENGKKRNFIRIRLERITLTI